MREPERARRALERAESETDEIRRSLWLAKAADWGIAGNAVLVGGAAVNLHTGSYRPTDVDLCAFLDENDRKALEELGFRHLGGDHFEYDFADHERWLLEFPDRVVDGQISRIALDEQEILDVIRLESLIVDRVLQATDQTGTTFDEAVRLCVAVFEKTDWDWVDREVGRRDSAEPGLALRDMYAKVMTHTKALLA